MLVRAKVIAEKLEAPRIFATTGGAVLIEIFKSVLLN
jgi:hypothetical protein